MNPLRRLDTVEVVGRSMAPSLEPGDRILVESWSLRQRPPRSGEVVLAPDPRLLTRELVKRVAAVGQNGVALIGDGHASSDSRAFGPVPLDAVRWRAAFRYWPLRRAGRIPNPTLTG